MFCQSLHDLEDEAEEVQHAHERELGLFFGKTSAMTLCAAVA